MFFRPRGCLTTILILVLLVVVCCGAVYFVAVPRVRDSVRDQIAENISTQVASQLDDVAVGAGTYTIDVAELRRALLANLNVDNIDEVQIRVTPSAITLSFDIGGRGVSYTGTPVVVNGRLMIDGMSVDNDAVGFFLPADKLAEAIENGVNDFFTARGLRIDSLELGDDEITFVTSPS